MSLSSTFSLAFVLFGCVLANDPSPNSDAPDLDFTNPQWVNEFQYDGVFDIKKTTSGFAQAHYYFNGALGKSFTPMDENNKIENGFWFDERVSKFMGPYKSYFTGIEARIAVNEMQFDINNRLPYLQLGNISAENKSLNFDPEIGLTWNIIEVNIPKTGSNYEQNKLTKDDEKSFITKKEGIKVFPESIKLDKEYRLSKEQKEIKIDFAPSKGADLIYVTLEFKRFNIGGFVPSGFLKYLKGDATSLVISKADLQNYVSDTNQITMTVSAIKFYTSKQGNRNFIFKNIGQSSSTIILE